MLAGRGALAAEDEVPHGADEIDEGRRPLCDIDLGEEEKDAARQAAFGPLIRAAGRREMSRCAATKSDIWTMPTKIVPTLDDVDISFQVFFFLAGRFVFLAICASFRCCWYIQSSVSGPACPES